MLTYDINTNKHFAMKIMNKLRLRRKTISMAENAYDGVQSEIAIMKKLNHPYILKLYEVIDDPTERRLFLITDYIKEGNLTTKIDQAYGKQQRHPRRSKTP